MGLEHTVLKRIAGSFIINKYLRGEILKKIVVLTAPTNNLSFECFSKEEITTSFLSLFIFFI